MDWSQEQNMDDSFQYEEYQLENNLNNTNQK